MLFSSNCKQKCLVIGMFIIGGYSIFIDTIDYPATKSRLICKCLLDFCNVFLFKTFY